MRSFVRRAFEGVSAIGITAIIALCALNGLRRSTPLMFGPDPLLPIFASQFAQSLLQAALLFVTVVPTVNLSPLRGWRRVALVSAVIIVASGVGIASIHLWPEPGYPIPRWVRWTGALRWSALAALLVGAWLFFRIEQDSAAVLHRAELARIALERQMTEARLQLLQAQIEPHFLFNTLAHIRLLYQSDPPLATCMLDNLMRYLAVALPHMRELESTLGREIDLVVAYLGLQQVRMGQRLRFDIDVAESLRALRVPPMMLLTLTENAIKHGVSPLPEGGSITVAASLENNRLALEVSDTGRGFEGVAGAGTGTGLANVRARLAALYGGNATLSLGPNRPRGVTVRFAVPQPHEMTARGAVAP
jgi:hypothetical protein